MSDEAYPEETEQQQPLEDTEITTNWSELSPTFDSMDLKEDLLRGIYAYGFERPSAIQQVSVFASFFIVSLWFIVFLSQRAIKPILMGRDVIAQAHSGKITFHLYCIEELELFYWNDYIIKYHLSSLISRADKYLWQNDQ